MDPTSPAPEQTTMQSRGFVGQAMNLGEEKTKLTTETQRPRSETFREGSRSLSVLCVSEVNFVLIRACPTKPLALRCCLPARWQSRIHPRLKCL